MSNNTDKILYNTDEEKLLVQIKHVQYEDIGKGKLMLTNRRLIFENKSGLFTSPNQAFSLDLSSISSAEINKSANTLIVEWADEDNEYTVTQLLLPKANTAVSLCRFLNDNLEILRKETELQQRKDSYQAFLWNTASDIWESVATLLQIIRDLTIEDWDAVDASLSRVAEITSALSANADLAVTDQVQTLIETGTSRDAVSVLQGVIDTMRSIGTSLQSEFPTDEKWGDLVFDDSQQLSWQDLRYIFLFVGWYRLLPLWQQLGETEKIEDTRPRLVTLSSLLERKITIESMQESPSPSEEQEVTDAADFIDAIAQSIESSLTIKTGLA